MSDRDSPIGNAVGIAAGLACLALAALDNVFGIGTRRHIRRFLRWPVDGVPIGDLLRSRVASDGWTGTHRECVHESRIECFEPSLGLCQWDVSSLAPVPWLRPQAWYITPVNRNAALLLPQLVPAGILVSEFPTGGPYAATFIHCQADPGHARSWLQPFVEGLRLSTNDPVAATNRQEE